VQKATGLDVRDTMTVPAWFFMALGVGALAVLATWRSPWRRAGVWFAIALAGQGVSLQLIDAGPSLHYQHYPPLGTMAADHPFLLAALAAQAVVVTLALVSRLRRGAAWSQIPAGRMALGVLLSVATAATVSPDVRRYAAELVFAASVQILSIATITVMAFALPPTALEAAGNWLSRVFGRPEEEGPARTVAPDRFVVALAATTTLLAATLSIWSYERHPHVPDEVAYLYHARYFAAGAMTMPTPPVLEAFEVDLLQYEPTRWFSPVPPGWPAVLAIGTAAGVPWLVNPVLGGLTVLLTGMLLGRLYGRRVARYGTLLLALSPWVLFLSMSFMTHLATLTFALAATLALLRARDTGSWWWGAASGAGVGLVSLVRPLDGVIVGGLLALWALGLGGTRLRFRALAGLGVGTVLVGALVFPYNAHLTGDPLVFPINVYNDIHYHPGANDYGFGPDRGMGWAIDPNPGHTPVDALINTDLNLFSLNTDLFGWSTGSLLFVALLLTVGGVRRLDRRMLAVIAAVYVAHFFYYFSGGPDFGARYWFLMAVPLVALTAAGIGLLERMAGARVGVAVVALTAMALVTFVPWRATDKYWHFRGMQGNLRTLVASHGIDGGLVLVRGERHPDYASAVILNPLDLDSGATIFAWDRDPGLRAEVLAAFPDRQVWLVDGPTLTDAGYRLAAGPVTAAELLQSTPGHGRADSSQPTEPGGVVPTPESPDVR